MATPRESFVFAGTEWNDGTNFRLQRFDPGIAPKRYLWVSGADSDGALSGDETHYDNAEMNLRVRIAPQASMDNALAKIGQLIDAIQEAENQPLGSAAVWTPSNSTKALTGYVLGGEVTGIPITMTGDDAGWLIKTPAPVLDIKLYRRPFWYGAEVTNAATATNTNPIQIVTLAGVTGDVPAEGRLEVTDGASKTRRHLEWGLEQRYYNASTSLQINSGSLTTTGFAGTSSTRSGSFNANIIRATLSKSPTAICGTGNLSHVGTFRVKVRAYIGGIGAGTTIGLRLVWQEGDGAFRASDWGTFTALPQSSGIAGWREFDLGLISVPETRFGTQKWSARIEGYLSSTGNASDVIDIDYIVPIPAGEGYGKARAAFTPATASTASARDGFSGTTAGSGLNGRTTEIGALTWTADAAFVFADGPGSEESVTMTTASGGTRFATLPTSFTDVQFESRVQRAAGATASPGLLARYVDSSNYAALTIADPGYLALSVLVAGTPITASPFIASPLLSRGVFYKLRLIVYASGLFYVDARPDGSEGVVASVLGFAAEFATGGALASGKCGFYDLRGASAGTTYWDDVFVGAPVAEPVVINSGRSAQFDHLDSLRQDSSGVYYGKVPSYRGARFLIPPAGSAARTSRILVKARRNDLDQQTLADDQIADSTTVAVSYTPRYLVAPR